MGGREIFFVAIFFLCSEIIFFKVAQGVMLEIARGKKDRIPVKLGSLADHRA